MFSALQNTHYACSAVQHHYFEETIRNSIGPLSQNGVRDTLQECTMNPVLEERSADEDMARF
jgi:hypothetical protein